MNNRQTSLFGSTRRSSVRPIEPNEETRALAHQIPKSLRFGTSSWSFPGWRGQVYADSSSAAELASDGLPAYAAHPLLRAVGIDRTWYSPIASHQFADYARQVPDTFRFLVKAHQDCTYLDIPDRSVQPKLRQPNPRFLNVDYALEHVIHPCQEGLGDKAGVLLFQFAPQDFGRIGGPAGFADALGNFLSRLPSGINYAVEVRNRALISVEYGNVLRESGAGHCAVVYPRMPSVETQVRVIRATKPKFMVGRWMLRPDLSYQKAVERFRPFETLAEPDTRSRAGFLQLLQAALEDDIPALVIVNNKAEGCAPESILALAKSLANQLESDPGPEV